ncbi:MAG: hypothetical protein R3E89_07825 [Thiolinea sp.]
MAQHAQRAAFRASLQRLLLQPQLYTPDYRRYEQFNRTVTLRLLSEIYGGLSSEQRQHLRRQLERYRDDFPQVIGGGVMLGGVNAGLG